MVEISPERLAELEKYEKKVLSKKKQTPEEKLAKIDMSTVGGRVRYFRHLKKISQHELASKVELSRHSISNAENEIFSLNFPNVLKVSEVLEVSVEDIDPWTIAEIRRIDEKAQKTDSAGKQ